MKQSLLVSAFLAAGVLSTPVEKRDVIVATTYDVVVQTVWVTVDGPAPTPAAAAVQTPQAAPHAAHNKPAQQSPAPAPQSPSPAAAAGPAPAAVGASNAYQSTVLNHHNLHRANHSAPPLVWSEDMASIAQTEAQVCTFAHNLAV